MGRGWGKGLWFYYLDHPKAQAAVVLVMRVYKQLYVPYVGFTWAEIPMWHPHGQYAQIEPTCDPFSIVCWLGGIFSLGPSQQIFSHAGNGLLGLHQY